MKQALSAFMAGDDGCADALVAGSRRRFPNPIVRAHTGRRLRFYDDLVHGRFVLVNFAYTRCEGSCPRSLGMLLAARALLAPRLGGEPDLVTLSLDPLHDTPEALARYIEARGAPAGWTFVTGPLADLERVRRFLGFKDPDPSVDADRTQHAALVAMGNDRTGRWQIASTLAGATSLAELAIRVAGAPSRGETGPEGHGSGGHSAGGQVHIQ